MAKRVYRSEDQAEAAKEKAARFVESVLHDPDGADEIRSEELEDWLSRTKRRIAENPKRREVKRMARKNGETLADVQRERDEAVDALEQAQEALDDAQDTISDILDQYEEDDSSLESDSENGDSDEDEE